MGYTVFVESSNHDFVCTCSSGPVTKTSRLLLNRSIDLRLLLCLSFPHHLVRSHRTAVAEGSWKALTHSPEVVGPSMYSIESTDYLLCKGGNLFPPARFK